MSWSEDNLRTALENALQELAETQNENLCATLRFIIGTNLVRGRIQSFLNGHENPTPRHYVRRVAETYERLHPYLVKLQETRSNEAWEPLYKLMCRKANHYFLRAGFPETKGTRELAEECASEAASRILIAHFPYDVEFHPWMYVLLRNVCAGRLKKTIKISEQDISEVEELLTDPSVPSGRKIERDIDFRNNLLNALEKISLARKQVILIHYFEGLTFPEIALAMGKTINAIHQIHFYALRDLEKLLRDETDQ